MKQLILQYAKDLTAGRLASGFEHASRVYHLARRVGEGMSFDDDVLHAACYLHNIVSPSSRGAEAAEMAERILRETGFPVDRIVLVRDAIATQVSDAAAQSVEAKLLHDANLLDTLGAVGVLRLSMGAFLWEHFQTLEEVSTYLSGWLEKGDSFYFDAARNLAEPKVKFMKQAIEQLSGELAL